nr:MAG TPA: hypothetical protein [Caudoviricetes sp.]
MISSEGVFRVATNSIFLSRTFMYSLTSGYCSLIYSLFSCPFKGSIYSLHCRHLFIYTFRACL